MRILILSFITLILSTSTATAVEVAVWPNLRVKPSAQNIAQHVVNTYGITNIGGWRSSDPFPDHPSGRAIDIMVSNVALGNRILNDIRGKFGGSIKYTLWQVKDHFDHIHVTVH